MTEGRYAGFKGAGRELCLGQTTRHVHIAGDGIYPIFMFWEFGVTDNLDTLSFSLPIANTSIVYTFPQGEPHAVFMKKKNGLKVCLLDCTGMLVVAALGRRRKRLRD